MRGVTAIALCVAISIVLAAAGPSLAASAQPTTTVTYQVRSGDTLWSVARRFGTTANRLAALNGLSPEGILRIGQPLRVPAPAPAAAPAAASPATVVYHVQSGDTPWTASTQDTPAADQVMAGPAAPETTPPAPAPNPSIASPQRPRIAPLPSRGAQWMTTIVALSKRYLGAPYRWGGIAPNGFDCSGFINYIFDQTGIDLPRTTFAMFAAGTPVPNDQLQAGDIVFFQTVSPGPSHAGVYLGDGRFIHTSSGQGRVTITTMAHPYYTARYLGARRF